MVRKILLWLAIAVLLAISEAGSLTDTFGVGVPGIRWGSTLDQVVGVYPDGDNVFSTTPDHRANKAASVRSMRPRAAQL
jgi:hypothetical protein